MKNIHDEKILIIDFGSQYTQLIARRVREIGVYSEVYPHDMIHRDFLNKFKPSGIILSGGPDTVYREDAPSVDLSVFSYGKPILGVCYGMQLIVDLMGGAVQTATKQEFGHADISVVHDNPLLPNSAQKEYKVWMSHGDHVVTLPEGFQCIAKTDNTPIAGIYCEQRQIFGLQFHPEVTHTQHGEAILQRFVSGVCACQGLWQMENIIDSAVELIREQVGGDHVLLGLSGGVDSSVAAVLIQKAIGASKLHCVFVDNGLLRLNEGNEVMQCFRDNLGMDVLRVNAQADFMNNLKGITDPEEKRKIIGVTFVRVFERASESIENIKWLAQGTIYPDVIESAGEKSGKANVIKSHHNVGGLPEDINFSLLEPLRELFKDEVRRMGVALGLPKEMLYRHPFPGPGLGIRIIGEVKEEYTRVLQQCDAIFIEELRSEGFYEQVSQAFAVFLGIKSVGVVGDQRRYQWVIGLRAVETVDFMTARWAHLPYDFLSHVSRRIMNENKYVARVVYDISDKPPSTIEWE